jgi:hypothetical protein
MDSDKRSAQVERLQVVDTGRRRRSSEEEKLKIVLESFQGPRQVAATERRYGLRGRCCCDGGGGFMPSQRMPPAHNWASSQRSWSQIRHAACVEDVDYRAPCAGYGQEGQDEGP